jgi:hypothetical protein
VPTSAPALTRELSVAATWEKYDGRAEDWVRCDPPARHAGILFDAQNFRYLSPLAGVARQPYFRELDGELIRQSWLRLSEQNPRVDKWSVCRV